MAESWVTYEDPAEERIGMWEEKLEISGGSTREIYRCERRRNLLPKLLLPALNTSNILNNLKAIEPISERV